MKKQNIKDSESIINQSQRDAKTIRYFFSSIWPHISVCDYR